MSSSNVRTVEHQMTRIDILTGIPFDEFRTVFERAAPAFDAEGIRRLTEGGATWSDIQQVVAASAPHDLLTYAMIDGTPLLSMAGHSTRAVEYLVGNHVIAETMFRHDPKALLYAPLRLLIYSDSDGTAIVSIDQPSKAFGSLGHPQISAVGAALDGKFAALLAAAGVDTGEVFRRR